MALPDRELLDAVCMAQSRLYARERTAFLDMQRKMRDGRIRLLSYGQRSWLQEAAARIGLGEKAVEGWRQVAKDIRGEGDYWNGLKTARRS